MEFVVPNSPTPAETPGTNTACHHCGESCPNDEIELEGKCFCCQGCKMVFEILNANDLCAYYDIDENAGISLKGRRLEHYAYLDDPDVREKLISFSDGERTKLRFHLPQIHCASCIWLLEHLYKLNEGVVQSNVNFPKKLIDLTFLESQTSLRKIVELLASIGYAPAINLSNLEDNTPKAVDKTLIYKIGLAGFAFGNIMLLSFPEYLGLSEQETGFQRLFGYLNIFLAIPLIFYSGWDYLKSAFLGLRHGNLNMDVPISLGILTLFIRSTYEIITLSGAGYLDSLAGLVFFLLIGKWFQQKTYHHLSFERDYKSYFPIAATVKDGLEETTVPVNKLEPGQTIVIRNGELIPADGILLKGEAHIDYSFVTGEADPVDKPIGNKLYAGGRQVGERIEITLTKKVAQSYLTELWNEEAFQKENSTTTGQLADKVAKYFTAVILSIAFSTLFYWMGKDVSLAINAFTAVLIIACPCAVALSVPFTFGNSLRILARNHFYLKNVHVIEVLNQISSVVFDKTGTLTGPQSSPIHFEGLPLSLEEKKLVKAIVRQSSHPASRQIDQFLGDPGQVPAIHNFREYPGKGIEATVNDRVVRVGSPAFTDADLLQEMRGVVVQIDGKIRGFFEIESQYRQGLREVIRTLKDKFKLYLLSGDNDREKEVLAPIFGSATDLHFQQSPKQKLAFVKDLQDQDERVLMLGDGLNDAGALKQSNAGIVVADDTNNFTPASDAILSADQFHRLPRFIEFARRSIRLVYGAYLLALVYNIIGLSFAVQGTLAPVIAAILMPASSITIVVFGVLSSNWLAYRMGLWRFADENQQTH